MQNTLTLTLVVLLLEHIINDQTERIGSDISLVFCRVRCFSICRLFDHMFL